MLPDIETITAEIVEVAAQEALPRFRALGERDVQRKASGDLVTVADLAVEAELARRFSALLPGSQVVGEEAVENDPSLLASLDGDAPVWIIDPIDGTGNFAAGKPNFAVMVALSRGREVLAAWIHEPVTGRSTVAEKGGGAYLDGARLSVSPPSLPEEMYGTLHSGSYGSREIARRLDRRRHLVNQIKSLRCAGLEYVRLAKSEMHFSFFTRTKPWDHVPGVLIHKEAGGTARLLEGRPYTPADHAAAGLLMAPDRDHWQRLYALLFAD
jgi:fructose-1,6-bisphosphatase/inositol monophosphatase family enzyme